MATGDSPEMQRMQEEAIKRAREVHSRAKLSPEEEEKPAKKSSKKSAGRSTSSRGRSKAEAPAEPEPKSQPEEETPEPEPVPEPPLGISENIPAPEKPMAETNDPPPNLLDNLFRDQDQTLILMLLILIGGESGNHELMFALLFLLM